MAGTLRCAQCCWLITGTYRRRPSPRTPHFTRYPASWPRNHFPRTIDLPTSPAPRILHMPCPVTFAMAPYSRSVPILYRATIYPVDRDRLCAESVRSHYHNFIITVTFD